MTYEVYNHQILSTTVYDDGAVEKKHKTYVNSLVLSQENAVISITSIHRETDGTSITEMAGTLPPSINAIVTNENFDDLTASITPSDSLDLSEYIGSGPTTIEVRADGYEPYKLEVIL